MGFFTKKKKRNRRDKYIFKDVSKNIKVSKPETHRGPVIVERIDKNKDIKLDLKDRRIRRYLIKDGNKINFKLKDS